MNYIDKHIKSINQDKKDNLNTKSEDYIEVVHIPDDEDKVKNNVIDIAQKDKAKTRLMELSKQSLAKEDDTKEKTKQNNQAGKKNYSHFLKKKPYSALPACWQCFRHALCRPMQRILATLIQGC